MKLKSIITIALATVFMVGVTSCEDMLKVDSKTLMLEKDVRWDSPVDTVYPVLGVIKKLQQVADRTIILGEIRGDLVALGDKKHVSEDLQDLYSYDFTSLKSTNKYDNPLDYYAIITNCNLYKAKVDTTVVRSERKVMKSEYINILNYRAWAYLQLAQIYGTVLYYDEPITVDKVDDGVPMNIKELAQTLLLDYNDEFITYYDKNPSNYGEFTVQGTKHKTNKFFIPIRLILGDLNLWAENYAKAALYYHDYLVNQAAVTTGTNSVHWQTYDFLYLGNDTYYSLFSEDNAQICYIPMEYEETDGGTVSDINNIFSSTTDNNGWYQLTRSAAATSISVRQNFCYHKRTDPSVRKEWATYLPDKNAESNVLRRGDLRMQSILETEYQVESDESVGTQTDISNEIQTLNKFNSEKICLYRKDVVFLRLAEALNRCGLPQTAFTILKTGLCQASIDSISQAEKDRAKNVDGVDMHEVYDFPLAKYTQASPSWTFVSRSQAQGGGQVYSFRWGTGNTIGIHSRGCGDANFDPNYRIPVDTVRIKTLTPEEALKDSIRAVEELLIDEMALETCFEGYRFGDLMRIAQHRGADIGGQYENEFLAKRVAIREKAVLDDNVDRYQEMDVDLYNKLLGDGKSLNKNWFLVLPDATPDAE